MKYLDANSNYIENLGVLVLGYNRPELLKKRLQELSTQEIENLYLSIDGGSGSNTLEMKELEEFATKEFNHIKKFSLEHYSRNLGVDLHLYTKVSEVLKIHDFVIVIEDDVKITSNFISNLKVGLQILKSKKVLGLVSSWSPLSCNSLQNKWRSSTYSFTWGWACSREVWADFQFDQSGNDVSRDLESSEKWRKLSNHQQVRWIARFKNLRNLKPVPWDIQFFCFGLKKNFTFLSPLFSFSDNEGWQDVRSTHNKQKKPRILSNFVLNEGSVKYFSKIFYKIADLTDRYYMNDYKLMHKLKRSIKH